MTEIVEVEQPQNPSSIGKWKSYPVYKDSGVVWLGKIPEHWEVRRLKHVFKVFNGATPSSSVPSYWDGSISWVTPEDLGSLADGLINATSRTITEEGYQSCGTSIVPVGSLILSTRAPIGHIAIATIPLCTNQGCRSLVFRRHSVQSFFLYLLLIMKQELQSWGQGSTFLELGKSKLEAIRIISPPLPDQRAIAAFLDHKTARINSLIAKKERLIELLQEKRAALISHAVTKGLDADVKMKDSGVEWLGEIPEHWEVKRLKFITQDGLINGIFKKKDQFGTGVKLINVVDLYRGDFLIDFASLDRVEANQQECKSFEVLPGDIFFVRSSLKLEGVGSSAMIADLLEPTVFDCYIVRIHPSRNHVVSKYLINFLNSMLVRQRLVALAGTTTMTTISQPELASLEVVLPPITEQRAIISYLEQETARIDALISKIGEAIEKLKEYSAALISAAVTGKIDVRETSSYYEE